MSEQDVNDDISESRELLREEGHDNNDSPDYYQLSYWSPNSNEGRGFNRNIPVSDKVTAVLFENQRWYPLVGWESPLPTERSNFSNGDGSRSSSKRPLAAQSFLWCVDFTKYPEFCDSEGWSYAFNFNHFSSAESQGINTGKNCFVRRRKWFSPVPLYLLNEKQKDLEISAGVVFDDSLIWTLTDSGTECLEDHSRTLSSYFSPGHTKRRGFLAVDGFKRLCILEDSCLFVYMEDSYALQKMANPILVLTLDSVYSIRPVPNGGGENYHILDHPLSFIFRISFKKDSYAFTGPNRREVISWFYDIKTVIKANRNLEAVGGVGAGIAAGLAALAVGFMISRSSR
ncbi:uncharacterized protein LOC135146558 [Zophobas morio]|uniref:uncharacterized protein LOC135146558 n=1 Tax=Zophobas morio TaxID=2755281 RepID=UPI003083C14F